ncbi:hypothetical protein PMI02_04341 [Novosphingobium sp. AP12]|nr:hypothetical protein PMI02_04341 [Novosphingobium sp. AP12]
MAGLFLLNGLLCDDGVADKAVEDDISHHVRPVSRASFEADVFNVPFYGTRGNGKLNCDLLCGKTEGNQTNYLALTTSEPELRIFQNHCKVPLIESLILKVML